MGGGGFDRAGDLFCEEVGVQPVLRDVEGDGEVACGEVAGFAHEFLGDGGDLVMFGVGGIDDDQFVGVEVFGVVFGFALTEAHGAFDGECIGEDLSEEEQDESGVDEQEAQFGFEGAEFFCSDEYEVEEHEATDEVASGEDGDLETSAAGGPEDEETLEVVVLDGVQALVFLGDGAEEDQHHGQREEQGRESERRKEPEQLIHYWGCLLLRRNSMKAAFWASAPWVSPVSL
ncbi:MAG: hypothetical protein RI897_3264 [Verrucomicrobiota bacterium]